MESTSGDLLGGKKDEIIKKQAQTFFGCRETEAWDATL